MRNICTPQAALQPDAANPSARQAGCLFQQGDEFHQTRLLMKVSGSFRFWSGTAPAPLMCIAAGERRAGPARPLESTVIAA